jgi:hypothetical protein
MCQKGLVVMRKWFAVVSIWTALGISALAQSSAYILMAVSGTFSGWATAPNMTLVSNYTWKTISPITLPDSGDFKFAANNAWGISWGGAAAICRVPAQATAISSGGDMHCSGLTPGGYHFLFNEQTGWFEIQWAGAPSVPAVSSMSLVGDFNQWAPGATAMTRDSSDVNKWSCEITLESQTDFQFSVNGATDGFWGPPEPQTMANGSVACAAGNAAFTILPGYAATYRISLNVSNNLVAVESMGGRDPIATMTVAGTLIVPGGSPLIGNMQRVSGSLWQSEHFIASAGNFSLYFAANMASPYEKTYWDSGSAVTDTLPVRRTLVTVSQPIGASKAAVYVPQSGR